MNKGENPTIMRFNRNAFVKSGGSVDSSAPVQDAAVPVSSVAPKKDFDAAKRLAELRAEAMQNVNKTVMSQLGLKKQVEASQAVPVRPTPMRSASMRPSPAHPTSAPVPARTKIARPTTPKSSTKAIPIDLIKDLPDDIFSDDVLPAKGLSLDDSPLPRRRTAAPDNRTSAQALARQRNRIRMAKKSLPRHLAKAASGPAIKPAPKLVTQNLSAMPIAQNTNLADMARKIAGPSPVKDYKAVIKNDKMKKRAHKLTKKQKIVGAMITSAVALGITAYVAYLSIPDLAVKIAASQAGLDVAYPSTTIQGFVMSDVSSNVGGEITINYSNKAESYKITQKKSSWDSDALLNNFIIPNWGGTYSVIREKGLTIYVANGRAAWVSGGIEFIIDATNANFSNEQLRSIALSM